MEQVPDYEDAAIVEKYADHADRGFQPAERYVVDEYFTDRTAAVLDLGCGTGRTTKPLADRGYDVTGVDICDALIEQARECHPDLSFDVGDATDLEFPDESFEYVLFAGRGIDDIRPASERLHAILEVYRVLEPGGVFAFDAENQVNRFLFDPRLREDWLSMARFVARNAPGGHLTDRYASVEFPNGVDVSHAIVPRAQHQQLADTGFHVEEVVKHEDSWRPVHLDPRPYYVARKPASSGSS